MKIPGIILRPCSTTQKGNEQTMRSSKHFTDSGFLDKYRGNIMINEMIAESAKIYILKNYKKIKDWSGLDVEVRCKQGTFHFYKYNDKGWNKELKFVKKMLAQREKNQNPINALTDVVLDPTDGDFSITINGKEYWWIDNDSIITIADYIEKSV